MWRTVHFTYSPFKKDNTTIHVGKKKRPMGIRHGLDSHGLPLRLPKILWPWVKLNWIAVQCLGDGNPGGDVHPLRFGDFLFIDSSRDVVYNHWYDIYIYREVICLWSWIYVYTYRCTCCRWMCRSLCYILSLAMPAIPANFYRPPTSLLKTSNSMVMHTYIRTYVRTPIRLHII